MLNVIMLNAMMLIVAFDLLVLLTAEYHYPEFYYDVLLC
jgi:hypothetical protein